ncbi:MAG: DUF86 domain-containing protein [Candidatus Thermoplasmatota archaeon]|nr:DUF86 domain-containing protein [Candidatus Thermoplasmatota archaeon]
MKERYIKKLETFEKEKEFIKSHKISDDVTRRALLYSLQICVETAMDIVAMKIKDSGMVVEDDYSNIQKLVEDRIIKPEEAELLREFNGIRNAIAHKYDKLDMDIIEEALGKIDEFSDVVVKISE